jgi:aldehyde:ferredoxin oxidoreductase
MALTAYIDVSTGKISIEETPKELLEKYLGSRGYAAKLLYDSVGTEVKPLDPDNLLIFSTGMFTGTAWPTGARFTVTAKSPLTGAYGYANSGGYFGPELKRAGFDALVIKGQSDKPIYLLVKDEKIEIKPAEEYWNYKVSELNKVLLEKHN